MPRKYGTAAGGEHVNAGQHCTAVVILPALGESDLVPDEGRPADALPNRRGRRRRRRRWRHVASGGEGGGEDGRLVVCEEGGSGKRLLFPGDTCGHDLRCAAPKIDR